MCSYSCNSLYTTKSIKASIIHNKNHNPLLSMSNTTISVPPVWVRTITGYILTTYIHCSSSDWLVGWWGYILPMYHKTCKYTHNRPIYIIQKNTANAVKADR